MAEIGATLREARMRGKIDINEVEGRTKIRAKYLRAIENEEWDLLPGEVYAKSFLRTYADFLGVDTPQLLDDFRRRYERPAEHELRPVAPLGRERERPGRGPVLPPWAVVGFVLVVVVVVLYFVGSSGNKPKPATTVSTHAGATHHGRHRKGHRPIRRVPPPPSKVTLALAPTGAVYVCLVDGTGKRLIPGQIFDTGQVIPTEVAPKLLLTLGNASVKMKVNGSTVPVMPSSTSIGYVLTPGSTRPLPPAEQPRCT